MAVLVRDRAEVRHDRERRQRLDEQQPEHPNDRRPCRELEQHRIRARVRDVEQEDPDRDRHRDDGARDMRRLVGGLGATERAWENPLASEGVHVTGRGVEERQLAGERTRDDQQPERIGQRRADVVAGQRVEGRDRLALELGIDALRHVVRSPPDRRRVAHEDVQDASASSVPKVAREKIRFGCRLSSP